LGRDWIEPIAFLVLPLHDLQPVLTEGKLKGSTDKGRAMLIVIHIIAHIIWCGELTPPQHLLVAGEGEGPGEYTDCTENWYRWTAPLCCNRPVETMALTNAAERNQR
jgi:hypothetical protein